MSVVDVSSGLVVKFWFELKINSHLSTLLCQSGEQADLLEWALHMEEVRMYANVTKIAYEVHVVLCIVLYCIVLCCVVCMYVCMYACNLM